jgi:hypothetical protein
MQNLKAALENLDAAIDELEEKIGVNVTHLTDQKQHLMKQAELLKVSRAREAALLAAGQKVSSRLDRTIATIEAVLKD